MTTLLPIVTPRLRLRAHALTDQAFLLSYYSDPTVTAYLPWSEWSNQDAQQAIAARLTRTGIDTPDQSLALIIETDCGPVGDIVLWAADRTMPRREIGRAIHPADQGNGYAKEAANAILDVTFFHYDMNRVRARVDPRNQAGTALCRSLHMRLEGHLRQDTWLQNDWVDTLVYGLLRDEWVTLAREHQGTQPSPRT